MDKRVVTQSFVMFGTGFALALYGTFIIACDVLGFGLRVFDMFGKNPLASYGSSEKTCNMAAEVDSSK